MAKVTVIQGLESNKNKNLLGLTTWHCIKLFLEVGCYRAGLVHTFLESMRQNKQAFINKIFKIHSFFVDECLFGFTNMHSALPLGITLLI